jgi:branched-chain amino acid transport system substrate-binding protein
MKKTGFWSLLAVMVVVLATGFGAWAEEGVTDTEIHIGQWGPQTGPAAAWGSVARGTDAMFKMINAEGGIHGRKLIHHMFDDGYNPAKTKAGVKELQEGIGMFAWVSGVGTATGLSVKDYLMERKIPWIGPSAGSLHWVTPPQKYLFAVYPLYYTEAKALCRYAVKTLGKKKVAIIYQNDDYGKNGVKGAKAELTRLGMELVAEVPVNVTDSDLKPHVMRLRKSGADAVLLWTNVKHAVMTVGISKAMKFAPQFMSTSTCSDFPLMMHISKGAWQGVISATFAELPDSTHALLQKYKADAFGKYAGKDERWGLFYYAGIGFAEPLVEAIRRCGRDLTREKLVQTLEQMKDFKGISGGISFKPFDANDPSCRQGQNQVFLVECLAGGKAKQLTDWITVE